MSTAAAEKGSVVVYAGVPYVIGSKMSTESLDALPVGTVVNAQGAYTCTKTNNGSSRDDRVWARSDTGRGTTLGDMFNTLVSIPEQLPVTVAGFKKRFAQGVVTEAAKWKKSHQTLARRALRELGLDGMVGMEVDAATEAPDGTVAIIGSPDQAGFAIMRCEKGVWAKVHGADPGDTYVAVVTSAPGAKDPFVEVEGDQEALISEFKDAVWQVGQDIKQRYKWCSAYDVLLASYGIADPAGQPSFEAWPTLVKGEGNRAELPVGAVLGVAKGDWGIFIKDAMPNVWRRIAGTRPQATGTMHLLFNGEGPLSIRDANALMEYLPSGSEVLLPAAEVDPEVPYLNAGGWWTQEGQRHGFTPEQFTKPVIIIGLPGLDNDDVDDLF